MYSTYGACPAHPRAGGENPFARAYCACPSGSSPRGRGKRGVDGRAESLIGLIPARAGKTAEFTGRDGQRQAHPRAGGENVVAETKNFSRAGSSPRGRGKQRPSVWPRPVHGLIPARAGKTQDSPPAGGGSRAHPRAGGENWAKSALVRTSVGSSPRGRGKRPPVYPAGHARGLIPARAGKTSGDRRRTRRSPAHPRAGGENALSPRFPVSTPGSSPRGRGKLQRQGQQHPVVGLIPARAGKTDAHRHSIARNPAHPRAGGENSGVGVGFGSSGGSSPRGRGKRA